MHLPTNKMHRPSTSQVLASGWTKSRAVRSHSSLSILIGGNELWPSGDPRGLMVKGCYFPQLPLDKLSTVWHPLARLPAVLKEGIEMRCIGENDWVASILGKRNETKTLPPKVLFLGPKKPEPPKLRKGII